MKIQKRLGSRFRAEILKTLKNSAICFGFAVASTVPAWSGNGNMLHGFGPVNSSMGGATAGMPMDDPVGTVVFNPALMAATEGTIISFGTEFFQDDPQIEVLLNDGTVGITNASTQLGILPSFGFTYRPPDSRWAFGFGLVGIAGFRTDYPEDPSSILFDTPPAGFGRIYTDHRVTKIPLALSFQATEKLALGLSINGYVAELAIAPLPYQVFDTINGARFYPQGDGLVSEYAISIQPGFLYQATPKFSVGGSLTTEQDFNSFSWNSTFANPADPRFGQHRPLDFDLDGPLIATVGTGYRVSDRTKVAVDVSWIKYDGVAGFGLPGGIIDGVVQPFGWDNVWAYKIGVEHQATDKLTLRGGYNYSDHPLPPENTLTATGAPAFFQHHFSAGLGYKLTENFSANMSLYWVPQSGETGPLEDLNNNVIGSIHTTNSLISGLIGFSWKFDAKHSEEGKAPVRGFGKAPAQEYAAVQPQSTTPAYATEAPAGLEQENEDLRRQLEELEAENAELRTRQRRPLFHR